MKWLAAALLWAIAPAAGAWCSMPPPANPTPGPPTQVANTPVMCWPSAAGISGSGRGYLQKDFPAVPGATAMGGSAWGWWCQKSDLTWVPTTIACLDKYCPATAIVAVRSALAASSPGAAVQALIDTYSVKVTDWAETNDYNCLHVNMLAALQATKPLDSAPQVYKSAGTGRIYLYKSNTQLGADTGRKTAPDTPCDCTSVKTTVGTSLYCALGGGPSTEVTYCTKR